MQLIVFTIEKEKFSDDDGYVSWTPLNRIIEADSALEAIDSVRDELGEALVAAVPVSEVAFAETTVTRVTSADPVDLGDPLNVVAYAPDPVES